MKKKIYDAILVVIIFITIYQIAFFSFEIFLWGIGALVFWIWVKKDLIAIIGWFTDKKTPQDVIKIFELPDFETQRKSYIELTALCCSTETQKELMPFFQTLNDHQDDNHFGTTLEFVIDFLTENNYCFIEKLDWKQEIEDLEIYLENILRKNYNGLKIDFPKHDETTTLFLEDVFGSYNICLQKHALQLGFIETQSDEYVFFVHKISDKEKIINLINTIGYEYFEK